MNDPQAKYPPKMRTTNWDTLNIQYPVKKYPITNASSEVIARQPRVQPEVIKPLKTPLEQIKDYIYDYNITKKLTRSQTAVDFNQKAPEMKRFNKHTSCTDNHYIYPPSGRVENRPPQCRVFGTTEMKSAYIEQQLPARFVTERDQFKHPVNQLLDASQTADPSWHQVLEPLDTTHEGFEKYLDTYLTTSRLHHRPYTADQLRRASASKVIVTFYTLSDVAWTRTPKPQNEWRSPVERPKSMYDREKFKEDFREIRAHNKLHWVPGSFRTETRDNYSALSTSKRPQVLEDEPRKYYIKSLANLPTNELLERLVIKNAYTTEYSHISEGKALNSSIDQYANRNKRLKDKI